MRGRVCRGISLRAQRQRACSSRQQHCPDEPGGVDRDNRCKASDNRLALACLTQARCHWDHGGPDDRTISVRHNDSLVRGTKHSDNAAERGQPQ